MTETKSENRPQLIPTLSLKDAAKAIELYKQAFGAVEEHKLLCPETGVVAHCGLRIGDGMVFIGEARPEIGCMAVENQSFYLYVPDADKAMEKAVKAGLTEIQKTEDTFWGDRMGTVSDGFGIKWSLSTHLRDVSEQELQDGMKKMMEKMKSQAA
ncbi:MAG: VOC family protein [Alphaproteobacteria bacterium]|nr:VOC family protein [Alphaproteobacteria bacterium]